MGCKDMCLVEPAITKIQTHVFQFSPIVEKIGTWAVVIQTLRFSLLKLLNLKS